jgi:hypothetical protein
MTLRRKKKELNTLKYYYLIDISESTSPDGPVTRESPYVTLMVHEPYLTWPMNK